MTFKTIASTISALLLALLLAAPTFASSLAQSSDKGLVGSWWVTVTTTMPSGKEVDQSVDTFTSDGTLIGSEDTSVSEPSESGPPLHSTASAGVWTSKGSNQYTVAFVQMQVDPQGHLAGTLDVTGHITLSADGNSFSGTSTGTIHLANGQSFSAPSTVIGKRITAESLPSMPNTGGGGTAGRSSASLPFGDIAFAACTFTVGG